MNDYFSVDQLKELQDEINTLENQIFDWEDKYTELWIFTAGQQSPNQLRIIEQASAGETPVRPRPKIHVLLASVLGVLFALGFVVVREYLDYTIKTTAELSKHLNLTSLGAVRRIQGKSAKDKLITSEDFFAPWSESYRMIRSNIQFMTIDKPIRSVLITSSLPGEGKSTTAANLGVVMAQADLKTIIIDSDLRRPTQHKIFQLPNTDGLTDLLRASEPDLNHYLKETAIPNLYVLPSGTLPSNPSELLGSQRMSRLLTDLREFADVIIADSPPVIAFTDAAVLSTRMDGVVLVTLAGQTRLDIVRQAIRNLRQVGASLLGAVLNGTASKDEALYYQAYYSTNNVNGHGQTHSPVRLPGSKQWRQRLAFKEQSVLKFNTSNEDSGEN
jgi:non-specific protein-tyrosine kinase